MSKLHIKDFSDRDACGEALATHVASVIHDAVNDNGKAHIVVSGGSTPAPFFAALSNHTLAWDNVYFIVADERWVPTDHEDSNERMLRRYIGSHGHVISLAPLNAQETLASGCKRLQESLKMIENIAFDYVILGMGDDGHTASLFPQHPTLSAALAGDAEQIIAVDESPKPPSQRVTLTGQRLLQCKHLALHITSDSKKSVLDDAVNAEVNNAPIAYFIHQDTTPLNVFWAA